MPTQSIPLGSSIPILQNVVYALPAQLCFINSVNPVQVSVDGTTWVALTGAESTGATTAAPLIRCPGGNTTIIAKSAAKQVAQVGGALPTAPLGQVLISQGVGVAPIFSASPTASRWGTVSANYDPFGCSITQGKVLTLALRLLGSPFATASAESIGELWNITDSTVNTIGATVAGGGSFNVLARWNGTIWKVAAV